MAGMQVASESLRIAMSPSLFRLKAHFAGRVQGVGFRYTVRQIAQGFAVTGQVRNLTDGRVELIAEGVESEVHAFVSEIKSQMNHHIKETAECVLDGGAQFRDFYIG